MKAKIIWFAAVTLMLLPGFGYTQQPGFLPIPPAFSVQTEREVPLKQYPLGVITKLAAFVRHGKPASTVILPNGLEAWTYEVGEGFGLRTYTLEFDQRGVVVDVLYNENGRHDGLSALQMQRQRKGAEKPVDEKIPEPWRQQ